MNAALTVEAVEGKAGLDAFVRYPFLLYRDDPCWVAPTLADHARELDASSNPFFEHGEAAYFLVRRGDRVVGRISAHVDSRYNDFHAPDSTGFWGFFDCDDDPSASHALFDAAAGWLAEKGRTVMVGPASFTLNHVAGALVDGFDSPPMPMMAYNPDYLPKLIEEAGFEGVQDLLAYRLDASAEIPADIRAFAASAVEDGFTFRPMDRRRYWDEVARFADVYNHAWERNWGFVPMTTREIRHLAEQLRPAIDPSLVFIAEREGETVAAGLTVPNVNEELVRYRGRIGPAGYARLLYRIKRHRFDSCRVVALGVKKAYRNTGVGAHLYVDTMEAARRRGFRWGEMSWILESNDAMNAGIRHMGGTVYKTYRMYARPTAI